MSLTTLLLLCASLFAGLAIGWGVAQRSVALARERAGSAEAQVGSYQARVNSLGEELDKLRVLVSEQASQVARAQAEREGALQQLEKLEIRVKAAESTRDQAVSRLADIERLGVRKDGDLAVATSQIRQLGDQLAERVAGASTLQAELENVRSAVRALQEERAQLKERTGALEELNSRKDAELLAQKRWMEEQSLHLQALFAKTASELLDEKASRFGKSNKDQIEALMKPFQEQLGDFRKRVDDVHTAETGARAMLQEQISNLAQRAADVGATANNLANAMLGNAKKQGNWGELQLSMLLEQAGFVKGQHFDVQVGARDDQDDQRFADTVLWLPGKECLVIDSKVTLPSWVDYCSTDDPSLRQTALASMAESMRKHYQDLAGKDYAQIVSNGRSIPFTLMFIPIEAAGIEAFRVSPDLFIEAQKRKIIMVTPTTLFCVLQLVSALWNIHDRQTNSLKIAEQGRLLLRKLGTFVSSFKSVGDSLVSATASYERAKDQLQAGKGNLVSVAERMAKLGVEAPREGELARLMDAGGTEITDIVVKGGEDPRLSGLPS